MTTYDYVVIGAGAGGSVVASRLSEDPKVKVLLLEYGGSDRNPMIYVPKGYFFTLKNPRYMYGYETLPVASTGNSEVWPRGKVLGGSTAVNGMMWLRGSPADYDALEAMGNPGWGWNEVVAAFRGIENHNLGGNHVRGGNGPLGVSVDATGERLNTAIMDAATSRLGWRQVDDMNIDDTERIGYTPCTIKNGVRTTAYSAFVRPHRRRSNLEIQTHTKAAELIFDGDRVVGVRARGKSGSVDHRAAKEVILCAGALETPMLLERSGIGRPEVLERAGVKVRVEAPMVGENLIEQRGVAIQFRLKEKAGPTEDLNTLPKQLWEGAKYLVSRRGPISTCGYDITCQFKSSPELGRPDLQGIFAPMALDTSSGSLGLARHSGVFFNAYQIRPETTSSIHITGSSPDAAPVVDSHFLEAEVDKAAIGAVAAKARAVMETAPIAELVAEEEWPGAAVSSPEDVVRYSAETGAGIAHAVGSAAMGPGEDGVVDARLRVRGVQGLRIADISVLPMQVSGNTQAPAMVVGWRAADLIREES